jgi:hypothetical protein
MLLIFAAQVIFLPLISLSIGIIGLGGLLFTALRFRRDDTTAIVTQQSAIFDDMKKLNEELRTTAGDLRTERDNLKHEVTRLSGQVDILTTELREAHAQMSGKMTRIEKKLDDSA